MIFAILDDGALVIAKDVADANQQIEPFDAESGATKFYDDRGRRLTPLFPDRSNAKLLGVKISNEPGRYELTLDTEPKKNFDEILPDVTYIEGNPWFNTVESVLQHINESRRKSRD